MQRKTRCIAYIILAVSAFCACAVIEIQLHLLASNFGGKIKAFPEKTSPDGSKFAMGVPKGISRPETTTEKPSNIEQRVLDVLRMDGATQNLSQLNLNRMSYQQLSLTCHSYLDSANAICRRKLRMGNFGDGGWEVCDDAEVRPRHPCIIYSFGIGNDFSFDDNMALWYKCHVYSFDPTMQMATYNRSHFVHFYKVGIADKTYTHARGWSYYTLSDLREMLGHSKSRINIIKMDIEGHEWDALHQMISTGQMKTVDQFLVEYHMFSQQHADLVKSLSVLQLLELEGFGIFYTHKNEGCGYHVDGYPGTASRCFEVHYRRVSGGAIPTG